MESKTSIDILHCAVNELNRSRQREKKTQPFQRLTLIACFTLSDKLATALVDEKNRPPETLALAAKAAVWRPANTLKAIGSEQEKEIKKTSRQFYN